MNDDGDIIVFDPEEVVRLDDLKPLVHERGGVDGDLVPMLPRRMRERLLGVIPSISRRGSPQASAGGGEDDPRTSSRFMFESSAKMAQCSLSTG